MAPQPNSHRRPDSPGFSWPVPLLSANFLRSISTLTFSTFCLNSSCTWARRTESVTRQGLLAQHPNLMPHSPAQFAHGCPPLSGRKSPSVPSFAAGGSLPWLGSAEAGGEEQNGKVWLVTPPDQSECSNPLASVIDLGKSSGTSAGIIEKNTFISWVNELVDKWGRCWWLLCYTHTHTHTHWGGYVCLGMKPSGRKTDLRSKEAQLPANTIWAPGSSHAWSSAPPWTFQFPEPVKSPCQFERGFLLLATFYHCKIRRKKKI